MTGQSVWTVSAAPRSFVLASPAWKLQPSEKALGQTDLGTVEGSGVHGVEGKCDLALAEAGVDE